MKIRRYGILLFLTLIASFFWGFPSTAHAHFLDSISVDAGIKITLGSIDLEVNSTANTRELKLSNEINEVELKDTVQNNGTLDGKLAYKIIAKNADGTNIDASLLKSLKVTVNNQELNMNNINQYSLVSTQDGDSFYLIPEETPKEVSMKVKLTSDIQQTQTINLEVEYMLFQTNGTIEEPLFCDSVKSNHKIILDKKDDFWPSEPIKSGNYKYVIDMPETFYFSTNREEWKFNYYHTSINHGTLYLESTKKVTDWEKVVRLQNAESFSYEIEPISAYRAKVHFYFDKNIFHSSTGISYYSGQIEFELSNGDKKWNKLSHPQKYTAGKLLLSSDNMNRDNGKIDENDENDIDLKQSSNQVVSLQYVSKNGDNFEKRDVVFDQSIVLSASLYIRIPIVNGIVFEKTEQLGTKGNATISLVNSLDDSGFWDTVAKYVADRFFTSQLKINLENSTTKQSVSEPLTRNLKNILLMKKNSQQTYSRQSRSLNLNNENSNEPSPLLIEESVPKDSNSSAENQPKVTKEKIPVKQPDKETPKNTEDSNHKPPVVDDEDSDVETPVPVEKKEEIPQEAIEEAPETIEEEKPSHLPIDEKFSYLEIKVEDKPYEVGITQEQLDWLMKFKTVDEFVAEVNDEADALFIKYDKIKGIENVEKFINQLAEIEQLDVTFEMKDHPKQQIVEIKIIK